MKKLPFEFYNRPDVLHIAKSLMGKILVTNWDGRITSGRIVELEAYAGAIDRASHAYSGKITPRNKVMFGEAGFAYVYLCYGIHHLFNIVTNRKDIPHAILVRALEPMKGTSLMLERTGKTQLDNSLTRGPGNVSKALGISTMNSGMSLRSRQLYLADDGFRYSRNEIHSSPRIGVEYAGEHALWPYRFYIKGNPFVSGRPK